MTIRIGIPNRGKLYNLAKKLVFNSFDIVEEHNNRKMIFDFEIEHNSVKYDFEIVCIRSTDIPYMLEKNIIQLGITGNDYFLESNANIIEVKNLNLLNGVLALIANKNSEITSLIDVVEMNDLICYSQYPNVSKTIFKKLNNVKLQKIDGAAETYLKLGKCDFVIDIVSSGSSYIENDLKVVTDLLPVSSYLYTNEIFSNEYPEILKWLVYKITGVKYEEDGTTINQFKKILEKISSYQSTYV